MTRKDRQRFVRAFKLVLVLEIGLKRGLDNRHSNPYPLWIPCPLCRFSKFQVVGHNADRTKTKYFSPTFYLHSG